LQGAIGCSVVVENKGGGGSNIGMGYVARADGDGYTGDQRLAVNPGLYETLPYDPFKDFAPPCYFNGTEEGPSGEDIVGIRVFLPDFNEVGGLGHDFEFRMVLPASVMCGQQCTPTKRAQHSKVAGNNERAGC
jgi:Tripartite tricarboxylate transporter family receptor